MTTGVGRTGVVGVLKNGAGPVVLLRTELDGLPVEEKTGLDYASTARTKDDNGVDVGADARVRPRRPHGGVDDDRAHHGRRLAPDGPARSC